ncbi:hybrid sensor histidine kinase/response regulator [Moorena bouillonii]|uniref:histidine kinase n=1 Tax=Moorena bouillonii PNG TaxID=568701 RepID=A0A1U7N1F5_9CYAN|nr:ATP-binding protein [Moorena bouillonii]OLT59787.1 hybrid sensor histidine kinase/response regulator [Moorena bouillonii PNG]
MDTHSLKILLVEDNPADADLLQIILTDAQEIQWSLVQVEKLQDAIDSLSKHHFDIVLLDLSLPDKQGLITVTKTHEVVPDLPIVVLTGLNDRVTALEALRKGAQDYLVKGKIDSELLIRTIRYAIERANTMKQLRQSEEQLQRLNEELEHRVAEQTDELRKKNQYLQQEIVSRKCLEEELRQALNKEKELNDLKSRIVSVVSHEYRTPLATILSSAELLEHYSHKWSDEKKQRHFKRIQTTVKHLTKLVSDVLLFSKAEAGKLELKPLPMDLLAFCQEIVEEFKLTAKPGLTINFNCMDNTKETSCCISQGWFDKAYLDEKLLRQILSNLLSNGIKYSPDGGDIQFDLIMSDHSTMFRIQDSGIGIPPEDQKRLFEAFQRSSNVGTISGTGLGLAIVKKCVNLHGGEICVESEVGVGTAFTVTLPLHSSHYSAKPNT